MTAIIDSRHPISWAILISLTCITFGISEKAVAHAALDKTAAPAGTTQYLRLIVAHGCGESATRTVRILLPSGVEYVSVGYKPSWTVETVSAKTSDDPGPITQVVWNGGNLPSKQFDYFEIKVVLPDEVGRKLYFKTVQECDVGSLRWIEVPENDKLDGELEYPAPVLALTSPES